MLTRAQLIRKYGLKSQTFDAIRGSLEAQPQGRHGNVFYDLTENDKLAVECSRNHNYSFGSDDQSVIHVMPFHRFMCLRFLTTSLEDLLDEIHYRHLVSTKFGKEYLKKLHGRFIKRLPKSLQELAREKAEPPKDLVNQYRLMLEVLGLGMLYDEPLWLETYFELLGDSGVKALVETIFTTQGDVREQQKALEELTGYQWKERGVDIYKTMFYDVDPMNSSAWKYYESRLKVSERQRKQAALGMSTTEFCVREGIRPHFQGTMEVAQMNLQRAINGIYELGIDANTKHPAPCV